MWFFRLRRMFRVAGRDALILFFAIRDPRTPRGLKVASAAALAWILSPIDPLPDIPLIGWVDDLLVLSVGLPLLLRRLPDAVREQAEGRADRFIAAWWPARKPVASGEPEEAPATVAQGLSGAAKAPRAKRARTSGAPAKSPAKSPAKAPAKAPAKTPRRPV